MGPLASEGALHGPCHVDARGPLVRKVWNVATREYDWVQEGIWIDGTDYDRDDAIEKWNSRYPKMVRKAILINIIQKYHDDKRSFTKMHNFLEAVESDVIAVNHGYVAAYLGLKNHKIAFGAIPAEYRDGIQAIATGNGKPFDRGQHKTRPSINSGAHSYREYHLRADQEGRATSALDGGMMLIYYSLGHAAATYSYYLVTHEVAHDKGKVEVALTGVSRDASIKRPWE